MEEEEEGKRSGVQGLTGDIRGGFGGSFVDIENVLQFVFLDSVPHFESPSFMFCLPTMYVCMYVIMPLCMNSILHDREKERERERERRFVYACMHGWE